MREGKYNLAIQDLEKAAKLNPEDPMAATLLSAAKDSLRAN